MMRWALPLFALALALSLSSGQPLPSLPFGGLGLAGAGLLQGAAATAMTLPPHGHAPPACDAPSLADAPGGRALAWVAAARGWPESPAVQAWRRFVDWSKGRPVGCVG